MDRLKSFFKEVSSRWSYRYALQREGVSSSLVILLPQEKIPKIQSLFYLVFPWIHQYPCSDESQVWIEPGFFLDYFVQYRKSVIFSALDIKKQASTWIFRKPRGCTLFYLFSRFGKSVWITKYPDWQTPNLDNLLAKTGFFLNPNLDKSKNNSGI